MAKVEGIERVTAGIKARAEQIGRESAVSVLVGYSSKYAIFVHENMEPKTLGQGVPRSSGLGHYWGPADYGPKFLERPARELSKNIWKIVSNVLRRGGTMLQALLTGGNYLQAESQKVVPVEYGFLRASAFTREEK